MGCEHFLLRLAVGWSFALAFSAMNHSTSARTSDIQDENVGKLEALKQQEAELARQLAAVRSEKMEVLRSKPLSIGIIGFGRFGQFIAKTFSKYGRVVVTSRSDYTEIANSMGAKYVPLNDPDSFLKENLDVVVVAVSILSFRSTVQDLAIALTRTTSRPLIVDVLSVKEHPRNIMLEFLPEDCDILCTHPMFGPDSGKNGWTNLNFVYEKTRLNRVVQQTYIDDVSPTVVDNERASNQVNDLAYKDQGSGVEGIDRMERFLSIWEEEGCRMVQLPCSAHDAYAANSQFITHLVGRVLGSQGLVQTPIDTSGFQSVLKLIDITTADSFDLFYGLYKYNDNSAETIRCLQSALDDVVHNLKTMEAEERREAPTEGSCNVIRTAKL